MMPTKGLKWGLLSTARINRRLISAIRSAHRAELLAVASRSQSRADAYAAEWEIPRAYDSYRALLADPDIDVVYIPLPNSLHAEWSLRAVEAGKHVLCEKPLVLAVADCDQIADAAEAARVVVAEAVMYLHHPLLRRARALVREGAVGELRLVRAAFSFTLDRPADVRWQQELGGGSLWDLGSYPVSLIRWFLGEPTEVFGWQTLAPSGVDESFAGLLRCGEGVLGAFDCSFRHPFRCEAEVVGSKGIMLIDRPFVLGPESRIQIRRDEREEVITLPSADPYRCEVESLTAAVLDGADLAVPLSSSRANVAALVALYESARQGAPRSLAQVRGGADPSQPGVVPGRHGHDTTVVLQV